MPLVVVADALLVCSFGTTPSTLGVLPSGPNVRQAGGKLVATIMDVRPQVNIRPFGLCSSLSNPQVAAATAAANGVLTPQPCIPVTSAPWAPGAARMTHGGLNVLTDVSRCACAWGGQISVQTAGQTTVSAE